jgi:hypothetical protein
VDARDKPGHDEFAERPANTTSVCAIALQLIARSDSDEAIHVSARGTMDCFAEPVIGCAHSRVKLARNDGEVAETKSHRRIMVIKS